MINWVLDHLFEVMVPLLVFTLVIVLGLWARFFLNKWLKRSRSPGVHNSALNEIFWHPSLLCIFFLGAYVAVEFSILPAKKLTGEGILSLLVISITWIALKLTQSVIQNFKATQSLTSVVLTISRVIIITLSALVVFDIWGVPTFPIIFILIAGIFIVSFTFRNTLDNVLGKLEIAYGEHLKIGDLIKLESGESGYIQSISWIQTIISTIEGNSIMIPNHKLMSMVIVKSASPNSAVQDLSNKQGLSNSPDLQLSEGSIKPAKQIAGLSVREVDVLKLIGGGATNQEIALKLVISEHTVKSHLRSILSKLNMRNRQQAAVYAEREGLVSAPCTQVQDT